MAKTQGLAGRCAAGIARGRRRGGQPAGPMAADGGLIEWARGADGGAGARGGRLSLSEPDQTRMAPRAVEDIRCSRVPIAGFCGCGRAEPSGCPPRNARGSAASGVTKARCRLSLIENSLERLRRAALAAKDPGVAAAVAATAARVEPITALEPRIAHRRIAIDLNRLRSEGYLPEEGQERRFADYCHRIKRPLVDRARLAGAQQDARLMLLTSALPGDGKTFMTVNLALSMARERDVSVLLVDGDLARGHLSHVLGMHREPGLLNALRDDALD